MSVKREIGINIIQHDFDAEKKVFLQQTKLYEFYNSGGVSSIELSNLVVSEFTALNIISELKLKQNEVNFLCYECSQQIKERKYINALAQIQGRKA